MEVSEKSVNGDKHQEVIVIVGPSNSGKSEIFNKLSKSYSVVANYAQTTIDPVRKEAVIGGRKFCIWDTPGLISLNICSEDESFAKDALIKENPDIILFVADSTRLKRSLVLLCQVLELGRPAALALTKTDETLRNGTAINIDKLSARLKIPVAKAVLFRKHDLDPVVEAINQSCVADRLIKYPRAVEEAIEEIRDSFQGVGKAVSRGMAILYLSGDKEATKILHGTGEDVASHAREAVVRFYRKSPLSNIMQITFNAREAWADKLAEEITQAATTRKTHGFAQKAAWASRHPVFGWPIVLAIMWVTFLGIGSIATWVASYLDNQIFIPLTGFISSHIANPFVNEFLVGDFGVLTLGVMNAIGTVTPILIVFFLIVNFLEDVGYLPNLSVLLNRLFSLFGLTGKAVLSMSIGFGCNTMATLTSRMLETKKERIIASALVALGVPCAVQLGVMIAILSTAPFSALVFVVATVLATQIAAGASMGRLLKSDKASDFIMELPPFQWPHPRNVVRKTYYRVKSFLKEALPLFALGAVLMFCLDKTGLLALMIKMAHPIVTGFLELPDKTTEVFMLVLSRRELGAVYFKNMVDAMEVDYYQIIVGLVVITLFIPCISNTMMMIKELGLRWAAAINATIIVIAVLVGGLLNLVVRIF